MATSDTKKPGRLIDWIILIFVLVVMGLLVADLLDNVRGEAMDVGGYYLPDDAMAKEAMRPSPTVNAIIDGME